jgi:hypothetical protein
MLFKPRLDPGSHTYSYYPQRPGAWTNLTRFVQPIPARFPGDDDPFADIVEAREQNLVPPIQLLSEGDSTFGQVAPSRFSQDHPGYSWSFLAWRITSGETPLKLLSFSTNPLAPQVLITEAGVLSEAIYISTGGPPTPEPPGVSIQAWDIATGGRTDGADFFSVAADPSLTASANAGFLPSTTAPAVKANDTRTATFHHWDAGWTIPDPTSSLLAIPANVSGLVIAWYSLHPISLPDPRRHPDPVRIPSPIFSPALDAFNAAVTLGSLASSLSPELRSEALELAQKQAAAAGEFFRQGTRKAGGRQE